MTNTPRPSAARWLLLALAGAAFAGGVLGAVYLFGPPPRPQPVEGRPLLRQSDEDEVFTEKQLGLQFMPPGNWSMQARSTESPSYHKPERMVVKYKRLIPGLDVAWIRVSVADVPADQPLTEYLTQRRAPEPGWKVTKKPEDMTLRGRPAARIVWGGTLDPDQKGPRPFACEITAVRRGGQVFLFAGTYLASDAKALKRIRTAVDSASFDPAEFAAAP